MCFWALLNIVKTAEKCYFVVKSLGFWRVKSRLMQSLFCQGNSLFWPIFLGLFEAKRCRGEKNADFCGKLCACQSECCNVKDYELARKSGEKGVFICPMKPLKIAILACVVAKLDVWRLQTSHLSFGFSLFRTREVGVWEKSLHYFVPKREPRVVNIFPIKLGRICNPP